MSWVCVKLVHSPIGRPQDQHGTVKGLGLKKLNQERWLKNTPEVRGMINRIPHLVKVLEESEKKPD